MANEQEQLVRRVAEQVLSAMGKTVIAAPIHPPIGTCTGDYSKFKETSPVAATVRDGSSEDAALRGVVTARHLQGKKNVRLASCARLTPLAMDYVKANGVVLDRGGVPSATSTAKPSFDGARGKQAANSTWVWWCDGREGNVEKVTGQLRTALKPLSSHRGLVDAVKEIASRVKSGKAAGGVLFVDTAARAACFANRCPSLRAVVGTCTGAVEQGVQLLGANVLIVEHPYHGWKSMRELIERFIGSPRGSLGEVDRQLKELSQCV